MRNPRRASGQKGLFAFDPDTLHQIARRAVGKPSHDEMVQAVVDGCIEEYGELIQPQEWIFNCAGGAVGVMKLLHASLSEYVLIFGSAIGTEGYSGRYRVGIHDFMLAGEMWTYTDDKLGERVVSRPGDAAYLAPERVKGYKLPEGGWMLEYGRGPIPTVLPFGLADSIFSMVDVENIWRTVSTYGKLTIKNLLRGKI
jgi:C-8 sterol isomerase